MLQRPELNQWAAPYWTAFHRLSGSRQMGIGVGPIPISEILAYCLLYGITDPEDIDDLVQIINGMDVVYLECVNKPKENRHGK